MMIGDHTPTPNPWWVAYLTALLGACLAFLSALFFMARKNKREDSERHEEEQKADAAWKLSVETRMSVLNTQVSPLWLVAQQKLSADLHHHGERYEEMDSLLEELDALTIDDFPGHRGRLEELLVHRSTDMHDDITQDQRDSAVALLIIMKKVITEAGTPGKLVKIGLVGIKEASVGEGENI